MNIKVVLKTENKTYSTITTAKYLLDNDEDELINDIICNKCEVFNRTYPSGEPLCYGECIEKANTTRML